MDPQAFSQMLQLNALRSNGSITQETFESMAAMVMAAAGMPSPVQNATPSVRPPVAAATTPLQLTDGVYSSRTELPTTPAGAQAEWPALMRYVNLSQSTN